jgi:hypothetical protein
MNVSTRHELQTLLDKIRTAQGPQGSNPLANQGAWVILTLSPLIGVVVSLGVRQPFASIFFICLLALFVGSLQSIIKYKFNILLRPILEALLYVPQVPVTQEEQIPKRTTKATKARTSRGGPRRGRLSLDKKG